MRLRLDILTAPGSVASFLSGSPEILIGRDPQCELCLEEEVVSWRHARLVLTAAGAYLTDLGSSNGTYLNDQPAEGRTRFREGDHIQLGRAGPVLRVVELDLTGAVLGQAPLPEQIAQPPAPDPSKKEKGPPPLPAVSADPPSDEPPPMVPPPIPAANMAPAPRPNQPPTIILPLSWIFGGGAVVLVLGILVAFLVFYQEKNGDQEAQQPQTPIIDHEKEPPPPPQKPQGQVKDKGKDTEPPVVKDKDKEKEKEPPTTGSQKKKKEKDVSPPPPLPPLPKEITNSIGLKLVLIPAGKFTMGSPSLEAERNPDEGPMHAVEISQPFYLGVYEVTQEEFTRVMGSHPSHFASKGGGRNEVEGQDTGRFPVETVTWNEAVEFCRKLADLPQEKEAGRFYRLPTEAEWEYACRAGTTTPFPAGTTLSAKQANFDGHYPYGAAPKSLPLDRTAKVGSYLPNPFGLFDMHGNVWEWCADWYDDKFYGLSPAKDPLGPAFGNRRVLRGGAWNGHGRFCRAACRFGNGPDSRLINHGFRVACQLSPKVP